MYLASVTQNISMLFQWEFIIMQIVPTLHYLLLTFWWHFAMYQYPIKHFPCMTDSLIISGNNFFTPNYEKLNK